LPVRDAFVQARRERRPVVIGIPFDLQARPLAGSDESAEAFARVAAAPFPDSAASRRSG
jgi:thiamine pyrophosphate-dependent acetolactate synthase large subunit-like protein